jgi:hypothetical protein
VPRFFISGTFRATRIRLNVILWFAAIKTYLRIRLGIHISLIHCLLKVHLKRHRYNLVFAFSSLFSVLHCSLHFFLYKYCTLQQRMWRIICFRSIDRQWCCRIDWTLFVVVWSDLWSMIDYSYSKKSTLLHESCLMSWLSSTANVFFFISFD